MARPPAAKRRRTARNDDVSTSIVSHATSTTTSRRTTRSQKPRLSAELLARVASYASLGQDLLSLCIVAGPKDCTVIRHAYLHRSQYYLLHFLHGYVIGKVKWETCRDRYRDWMEVNPDWRTSVVSDWRIENLNKVTIADTDGGVLVHPFLPFNNPAISIELGLTEVLRHLVEEKGLGVNDYRWNSYLMCKDFGELASHLLSHCIDCFNLEAFQYLLGRKDIVIDSTVSQKERSPSIVRVAFRQPGATAFLRELVVHLSFDIKRSLSVWGDSDAVSPLHWAIQYLSIDSKEKWFDLQTWKANFQLLLEVGADPYLQTGHGDAIQFAKAELANCPGHQGLKDAVDILEDWVAIK